MQKEQALMILSDFKRDFADQYGILRIGLFGSTVRGEAISESDVDIVVETKTPDMFAIVHARNTLKSLFKTEIDIIRYREKMNPYLKNNIENEAVFV